MMWKAMELSLNMWHKIGSDFSWKVTPTSKTNQGQRDLALWKMRPCPKWMNNCQAHWQQNLVLNKATSSDTSINMVLRTDTEIAWNTKKLFTQSGKCLSWKFSLNTLLLHPCPSISMFSYTLLIVLLGFMAYQLL